MNQNTWISWITTGIGLAGSAAATKGLIDQSTATSIAGMAVTLVPLAWGLFIHRDAKVVQTASQVQGVEPIKIAPSAPAALLELAHDDSVPNVKPEIPPAFTPSASMRR